MEILTTAAQILFKSAYPLTDFESVSVQQRNNTDIDDEWIDIFFCSLSVFGKNVFLISKRLINNWCIMF